MVSAGAFWILHPIGAKDFECPHEHPQQLCVDVQAAYRGHSSAHAAQQSLRAQTALGQVLTGQQ